MFVINRITQKQATFLAFTMLLRNIYTGANYIQLLAKSLHYNYHDPRWVTFKQLEKIQEENSDKILIKRGEKATQLIRPINIYYRKNETTDKINILSKTEIEDYLEIDEEDRDTTVKNFLSFVPFKVFNAQQIHNFPEMPKIENHGLSQQDINENIDNFIACSNVPVYHGEYEYPCFFNNKNVILMIYPGRFSNNDSYYYTKLHEFYHSTGHKDKENRFKPGNKKEDYAFEEVRAKLFSLFMAKLLNLDIDLKNCVGYIKTWAKTNQRNKIYLAASEVGKMLIAFNEFNNGKQPNLKWFPEPSEWESLINQQRIRDKEHNLYKDDVDENDAPITISTKSKHSNDEKRMMLKKMIQKQ